MNILKALQKLHRYLVILPAVINFNLFLNDLCRHIGTCVCGKLNIITI